MGVGGCGAGALDGGGEGAAVADSGEGGGDDGVGGGVVEELAWARVGDVGGWDQGVARDGKGGEGVG